MKLKSAWLSVCLSCAVLCKKKPLFRVITIILFSDNPPIITISIVSRLIYYHYILLDYDCDSFGPDNSDHQGVVMQAFASESRSIQCKTGYWNDVGSSKVQSFQIVCTTEGWISSTGTQIECLGLVCPPIMIEHSTVGTLSGKTHADGKQYIYCMPGMVTTDTSELVFVMNCQVDGTWDRNGSCMACQSEAFTKVLDNSTGLKTNCGAPSYWFPDVDLDSCMELADTAGMTAVHWVSGWKCMGVDCQAPLVESLVSQQAADYVDVYAKGPVNLALGAGVYAKGGFLQSSMLTDGNRDPGAAMTLPGTLSNWGLLTWVCVSFNYWYYVERVTIIFGNTEPGDALVDVYIQMNRADWSKRQLCATKKYWAAKMTFFKCPKVLAHSICVSRTGGDMQISEIEAFRFPVHDRTNKAIGQPTWQWKGNSKHTARAVDGNMDTRTSRSPHTCLKTGQVVTDGASWWSVQLTTTYKLAMVVITHPDEYNEKVTQFRIYASKDITRTSTNPMRWVNNYETCVTKSHLQLSNTTSFVFDQPFSGQYVTIWHRHTVLSICEVEVYIMDDVQKGFLLLGKGMCPDTGAALKNVSSLSDCLSTAQQYDYEAVSWNAATYDCIGTQKCDRIHLQNSSTTTDLTTYTRIAKACSTLTQYSNAAFSYGTQTTAYFGEKFTVECVYGFSMDSNSHQRKFYPICLPDGTMKYATAVCTATPCPDFTPTHSNATLIGQRHGDPAVTVACEYGYVISDKITNIYTTKCETGYWSTQEHCQKIRCSATTSNTEIALDDEFGAILDVVCNVGYIHAEGQQITYTNYTDIRKTGYTTECLITGLWSRVFNCEPTPCFLKAPANHASQYLMTHYPDTLTVACEPGFITTNSPATMPTSAINFNNYRQYGNQNYMIECRADGTFSATQECIRTPCFTPQPANTIGNSHMYGYYTDIINVTCMLGYRTTQWGSQYLSNTNYRMYELKTYQAKCEVNGEWDKIYDCTKTPCYYAPDVKGATNATKTLLKTGVYMDNKIITCWPGYITHSIDPTLLKLENYKTDQITHYISKCMDDGYWSKTSDCIETWCHEPFPENLTITGNLTEQYHKENPVWHTLHCLSGYITHNSSGSITHENYRLEGIDQYTTKCAANEQFSSWKSCTSTPCLSSAPANTTQGELRGYLNDVINVTCIIGYVTSLQGPAALTFSNYVTLMILSYNTTCMSDGEWNYTMGCRPVPCHHVFPANTSTGDIQGFYNDTFEVICNLGYITPMLGTPHILNHTNYRTMGRLSYNTTCQDDGTWGYIAACARTPCFTQQPENTEGTSPMEGYYSDVITVTCNLGYRTSQLGPQYLNSINYRMHELKEYQAECEADGEWNMTHGCTKTPCTYVNYVAGANDMSKYLLRSGVYMDNKTIICKLGFISHSKHPRQLNRENYKTEQITNYTATCGDDGKWSKTSHCINTWCHELLPKNLTRTGYLTARYNQLSPVLYTLYCLSGYITHNSNSSITHENYRLDGINQYETKCLYNEQFSRWKNCTPTPCLAPAPNNTTQGELRAYLNDVINVTCIFGYVASLQGHVALTFSNNETLMVHSYNTTCMPDGEWNYIMSCTPVLCHHAAPANTSTGEIHGYYNNTFEVICNLGYITTMLGTPHILNHTNFKTLGWLSYNTTCQHNGTWSSVNDCVRTPCFNNKPLGTTLANDMMGYYLDTLTVNCSAGWVTHNIYGASYINHTNWETEGHTMYQSTCLSSGEWSKTMDCKSASSECYVTLPPDYNLTTTEMKGMKDDELAMECIRGHWNATTHERVYFSVCTDTGQWSRQEPCERIVCPNLTIANSNASEVSTAWDGTLTITCDEGFLTEGDERPDFTVTCSDDVTYTGIRVCKDYHCEALFINNSDVNNKTTMQGESMLGHCLLGFETDDLRPDFIVKCTQERTWTDLKNCSRILCKPLTIEKALTEDGVPALNLVKQFEDSLTLHCELGFQFESGLVELTVQCMDNSGWSGSDKCGPVMCYTPIPNPLNIQGPMISEFPKVIQVRCVDGHRTVDDKTNYISQCTAYGNWSRTEDCSVLECTSISASSRMLTADIPTKTYLQTHEAWCIPGYTLHDGSTVQKLTCNQYRQWRESKCFPVRCPSLIAANSNGSNTMSLYGLSIRVTCDSMYRLSGGDFTYITECQADRKWTRDEDCERIMCPPLTVPNTNIVDKVLECGKNVTGQCLAGYSAVSKDITIRCTEDGKLEKSSIVCEWIQCSKLTIHYSNMGFGVKGSYGDVHQVTCNEGYVLDIDTDSITTQVMCTIDQKWVPEITCTPINCGPPVMGPSIYHTTELNQKTVFETRVEFACSPGYSTMGGNEMATCLSDGTWSPLPTCWKDCDPLPLIANGTKSNNLTKSKSSVRYECHPGFFITGTSQVSCDTAGRWSDTTPPSCLAIPVDGVWNMWGDWSVCTEACSGGTHERNRTCKEPTHGGKVCQGEATSSEDCNTVPCPIDGIMAEWSNWTECIVSTSDCSTGSRRRTQTCIPPKHGGKACEHKNIVKVEDCDMECPETGSGSSSAAAAVTETAKELMKSADDNRRSAQLTGVVAVLFMCLSMSFIVALDLMSICMNVSIKASKSFTVVRKPAPGS